MKQCTLGVHRADLEFFFVNSEILGIQIWPKKRVKNDKFEIARKQR